MPEQVERNICRPRRSSKHVCAGGVSLFLRRPWAPVLREWLEVSPPFVLCQDMHQGNMPCDPTWGGLGRVPQASFGPTPEEVSGVKAL